MRRQARLLFRRSALSSTPIPDLHAAKIGQWHRPPHVFPAGVELFQQGEPAQEVFHLQRGLVKLLRIYPDGGEAIAGLRRGGAFLGADAVILGHPHSVTAVTITSASVGKIPAAEFLRNLRSHPEAAWEVQMQQSREVHEGLERITDLERLSAKDRLKRFLYYLASMRGLPATPAPVRVDLLLKHREIAQLIAVTPPYLCLLWSELESEGLIKRTVSSLVLDPALLRSIGHS